MIYLGSRGKFSKKTLANMYICTFLYICIYVCMHMYVQSKVVLCKAFLRKPNERAVIRKIVDILGSLYVVALTTKTMDHFTIWKDQ
jgi:hypothetical protein